jgi:hypothetical protein
MMKRRNFLQYGGIATAFSVVAPSVYGLSFGDSTETEVKKVHLIFKTHLDVGFTELASKVIKTYMEEFIPGALTLSETLRQKDQDNRFVWTTGSWLIYKFLEKAEPVMRKRMELAIEHGDISWHGLPFTTHSELADSSLFDLGIQLSAALDKRFGKKTIAAKMTDVPGHTRGIVPVLAKNGIEFLHIGDNPASMPPDVPPLFVWRAPDQSEVVVMYQKDYGSRMTLPDGQTVVDICFTSDNHGPQKPEQIAQIYAGLHKQFPHAEVIASTLNSVAKEILPIRSQLPVVTREIGDTWIHGVGSDPLMVAKFREISRLRTKWLKDQTLGFGDPVDLAFGIPLLSVAEHTWGLDVKTFLADWNIYSPADFKAARSKPNFRLMEQSWQEKRQNIDDAIQNLPDDKASEVKEKLQRLIPSRVDRSAYGKVNDINNEIDTRFFKLKVDGENGSIISLKDKSSGFDWAGKNNPLCLYAYQTFSKADYDRYQDQYLTQKVDWSVNDFGKNGQEIAHAVSKTWLPALESVWMKNDSKGKTLLLELVISDEKARTAGGCPENISVELFFPNDEKEFQAALQWFNKPACRIPEASWFSFIPAIQSGTWILDKMDQPVDFRDVVKNGNRKLHAIQTGVRLTKNSDECTIRSLDAPLVAPDERTLLNFDNRLPQADGGVHFCLHNNVWGTNFRMWFDEDMKYRFVFKA